MVDGALQQLIQGLGNQGPVSLEVATEPAAVPIEADVAARPGDEQPACYRPAHAAWGFLRASEHEKGQRPEHEPVPVTSDQAQGEPPDDGEEALADGGGGG